MSNNSFLFLRIFFVSLTIYLIYQLQTDLHRLQTTVKDLAPPPSEQPKEKMITCHDWKKKIDGCIKDAQKCLKVVKNYSDKHTGYEKEFDRCKKRNRRNSNRNSELREELMMIQDKMNKMTMEQMSL